MKLEAMIRRLYTGCGGHVDFTSVTDYETKVNKNISQSVENHGLFIYAVYQLVTVALIYFLICLSDSTPFNLEKKYNRELQENAFVATLVTDCSGEHFAVNQV